MNGSQKKAKAVLKEFPGFMNELTDYNFNQVSLTKCNLFAVYCVFLCHRGYTSPSTGLSRV